MLIPHSGVSAIGQQYTDSTDVPEEGGDTQRSSSKVVAGIHRCAVNRRHDEFRHPLMLGTLGLRADVDCVGGVRNVSGGGFVRVGGVVGVGVTHRWRGDVPPPPPRLSVERDMKGRRLQPSRRDGVRTRLQQRFATRDVAPRHRPV